MYTEAFECSFVKAALDYGVDPLLAVQLLKLAVVAAPSTKSALPAPKAPALPASPSFKPQQFNPYSQPIQQPNIPHIDGDMKNTVKMGPGIPADPPMTEPMRPAEHDGWELKGYSSSGGKGDYVYKIPGGGYEHTDHAVDQQEEQSYNKRQGISSSTPKPVQEPVGQSDWSRLSQVAPPQKGTVTNGEDLVRPNSTPGSLASAIQADPYASAVMPKPDSIMTGGMNSAPPPDQMEHNLQLNLAQNPEANRMFQNWEQQHGLSGANASKDPGVLDSVLRQLLQELKGYSRQDPQRAQQMYHQLFNPPSYNVQ